jgi:transcription initiation factor IIE alpha subunit
MFAYHSDPWAPINIEEMVRKTGMNVDEVKNALNELEKKNLIIVVNHPLMIPRYMINFDEIERLENQSKQGGEA